MLRRMRTPALLAFMVAFSASCGGEPPSPKAAPPPTVSAPSASASASPVAATKVVRHVVVNQKRPSGTSVTTTSPDGTITTAFEVVDNGRGPRTDAKIRLAADGTLASFEATGHHELGTQFEERFAIERGHATWKGTDEAGERDVTGAAFFVPIAALPSATGLLVDALLKAGGSLPLLPSGTARVEKVGDATVNAGSKSRHVVAYAVIGLEAVPFYVWMDDDGAWFGFVEPWFAVVPEGWESAIDLLVQKQEQLRRERDLAIAKHTAHAPPAAGLALTHARVLDVERGTWLADQTVVVVGDAIRTVGPTKTTKIPAGAETVDLAGKAVLPGLWDMHEHVFPPQGALDIACGVTTARDVGNVPAVLDDAKKRFDDGTAVGPHLLRYGLIEGRGDKAASSEVTAENETEAKAAVELFAKLGYEGIKIYNSVKPELVPFIAKEAHARGMLVTGHVPVHMLASDVVRAGYDGIEHVNMLFLNFFATRETDTRTTVRFSLVGEKAAELDFKSKPVIDFFALLREKNVVVDPTLVTFEQDYLGEHGKVLDGIASTVARLPLQEQRHFVIGGLPASGSELYKRSWDKMLGIVKALRDAKVQVVVGTDNVQGVMIARELELFVRGGIAPIDALRMATIEPARAMKLGKKTGSVAVGKVADLVVVDGDPLANVGDVRNVVTTIRGGVSFASRDLLDVLGVKPAK